MLTQDLLNYLFWLIEYVGYYNIVIVIIILYLAYYLISNTFMFIMFIIIGIFIGIYISSYIKDYYNYASKKYNVRRVAPKRRGRPKKQ